MVQIVKILIVHSLPVPCNLSLSGNTVNLNCSYRSTYFAEYDIQFSLVPRIVSFHKWHELGVKSNSHVLSMYDESERNFVLSGYDVH
jgi:hypothetical protein